MDFLVLSGSLSGGLCRVALLTSVLCGTAFAQQAETVATTPAEAPDPVAPLQLPEVVAPLEELPAAPEEEMATTTPPASDAGAEDADDAEDAEDAREYELEEQVIVGRAEKLVGLAPSASYGRVGQAQIEYRPILRGGEVLELIPGMIATQHSGSGKANQYFFRGFNLDHGTDFAGFVDGVPVNLPTHGHGQGYLDLNFVIPELIEAVEYRKGPYWAEIGDFSSAGAADIQLYRRLPKGFTKVGIGTDNFYRLLTADSFDFGPGHLLYAAEAQLYDGPWKNEEDLQKVNGLLKYTLGDNQHGVAFNLSAYSNEWDSTDQVPERAVEAGLLPRLGTVDPTDGGETTRISGYADWWREWANGSRSKAKVYTTFYDFNLYSNFTYFLDDPVNGDQFEQVDRRVTSGFDLGHNWLLEVLGRQIDNTVGLQFRNDTIDEVGLHRTAQRSRLSTVRTDQVNESTVGAYYKGEIQFLEKLRGELGVRGDFFYFDVDADDSSNSGSRTDWIISPKGGLVVGPWLDTEFYANAGTGFHSNDARGTTISVDPVGGGPAERVDPIVRSKGAEAGIRTQAIPGLVTTFAYFYLDLANELLFVGDAGNTETTRSTRRHGFEVSNYYKPTDWLTLEADFAHTHARFKNDRGDGDRIPNSIDFVASGGATVEFPFGLTTGLRLRHFGTSPLIEDNSVRSDPTTLVNLKLAYEVTERLRIDLDVLNLLDEEDRDISYFYPSRLAGEAAAGVDDVHFHPVESIQFRFYLTWFFS